MATSQVSLLAYLGNDTDFRSWVDGLHGQFAAVGLVQTSDTGQLATPCVASRPSTSSYAGYEIWRFADTLQATCPIFIKIEYGIGSVADRPALRVQCASGTNGSGTLTGQVQSAAVVCAAAASKTSTVTLPSYVSGGSGWFHMVTNLDNATTTFSIRLFVERPTNGDGTHATTGFWCAAGATSSTNQAVIPVAGTVPSNTTQAVLPRSDGQVTKAGTNVSLWDAPISCGAGSYSTKLLCYKHADIGELVAITADHHGASHTLMPMGDGLYSMSGATADTTAIRWE